MVFRYFWNFRYFKVMCDIHGSSEGSMKGLGRDWDCEFESCRVKGSGFQAY